MRSYKELKKKAGINPDDTYKVVFEVITDSEEDIKEMLSFGHRIDYYNYEEKEGRPGDYVFARDIKGEYLKDYLKQINSSNLTADDIYVYNMDDEDEQYDNWGDIRSQIFGE